MKKAIVRLIFSIFCGLNLFGNDNNFTNKFDYYMENNKLYQKGCDNGDSIACFNLGKNYSEGLGVEFSHPKANEFYKKACDGGIALSCYNLGINYFEGVGIVQDNSKAIELYKKACKGEIIDSCKILGVIYKDGINQDTKKAKEFFEKARDLENKLAFPIYPNLNQK